MFLVRDVIALAVSWSRSVVPKVVRRRRGAGQHVHVPRGCGRMTQELSSGWMMSGQLSSALTDSMSSRRNCCDDC